MKKNNMDIMMNNLNNNTTLDQFMVNPELIKKVLSTCRETHKFVNDEGVYLVGFNGQFRTSRR
jgi:DNA replication protein DnaC